MTMGRWLAAASAAATLGALAAAVPAYAQGYGYGGGGYGGGYGGDYGPPRRYERRYDPDYDDRPPPPRYGRRGGSICVTARGNCRYPPQPYNTPCECDIPGFGTKRGAIGG